MNASDKDYRDARMRNADYAESMDFPDFSRDPDIDSATKAVMMLEDSVKSGRLYSAAELSDQITLFWGSVLKARFPEIFKRVNLERLKRLSYLMFMREERRYSEILCQEAGLDQFLAKTCNASTADEESVAQINQFCFDMFTVVGTTLWREESKDSFIAGYDKCALLAARMSELYKNRWVIQAFLLGLHGRWLAWHENKFDVVVAEFDAGLALCTDKLKHARVKLHLIVYCLEYILDALREMRPPFVEVEQKRAIFQAKIKDFNETCVAIRSHSSDTFTTILSLHALLLEIDTLKCRIFASEAGVEKQIEEARRNIWLETHRSGLGEIKPAPPLLLNVATLINEQNAEFSKAQNGVELGAWLRKIDAESMERVAAIYFEHEGFTVIEPPEQKPSIDLYVEYLDPLKNITRTAVQVKHWRKAFREDDYRDWIHTLANLPAEERAKISHFHFFVTKLSTDITTKKMENLLKALLPNLVSRVSFVTLNEAAMLFARSPKVLPKIFAAVRGMKAKTHSTK